VGAAGCNFTKDLQSLNILKTKTKNWYIKIQTIRGNRRYYYVSFFCYTLYNIVYSLYRYQYFSWAECNYQGFCDLYMAISVTLAVIILFLYRFKYVLYIIPVCIQSATRKPTYKIPIITIPTTNILCRSGV